MCLSLGPSATGAISGSTLWESFNEQTFSQGPQRAIPDGAGGLFVYFQPMNLAGGEGWGIPIRLRQSDGQVDPAFTPGSRFTQIGAVAVQPDGRIVVAGDHNEATVVLRLRQDGQVDDSFSAPTFDRGVRFITLQPDGKLILTVTDNSSPEAPANAIHVPHPTLYRLHPDGALDLTFQPPTMEGSQINLYAPPVVDQAGQVYVGGRFSGINGTPRVNFARLNPDGRVDATYPASASIAEGLQSRYVRGIGLQSDGSAVVAGDFMIPPSSDPAAPKWAALRFDAQGRHDRDFAKVPIGAVRGLTGSGPRHLLMLSNGCFVVVSGKLVRFAKNGEIDSTFHQPVLGNEAFWVARLDDNRLVVPSVLSADQQPVGGVAVFSENGDVQGSWQAPGFGNRVETRSPTLTADGRLAFAGQFNRVGSASQLGLALCSLSHGGLQGPQPDLASLHRSGPWLAVSMSADPPALAEGPNGSLWYLVNVPTLDGWDQGLFGRFRLADAQRDPTLDLDRIPYEVDESLTQMTHLIAAGGGTIILISLTAQAAVNEQLAWKLMPEGHQAQDLIDLPGPLAQLLARVTRDTQNTLDSVRLGALRLAGASPTSRWLALIYDIHGKARVAKLDANFEMVAGFRSPVVDNPGEAKYEWIWEVVDPVNENERVVVPLVGFQNGRIFQDACELPDGRVLVVGAFEEIGLQPKPYLARLTAEGAVDTSFPGLPLDYQAGHAGVHPELLAVAVDGAGRIYVAGRFTSIGQYPLPGLARLTPDGEVDPGFIPGLRYVPASVEQAELLISDGRLVVVGPFCSQEEVIPPAFTVLDIDDPTGTASVTVEAGATKLAAGQSTTLAANVQGLALPGYQWFKGGEIIPGATERTLTIDAARRTDAGAYSVAVTGASGRVISRQLEVVVDVPVHLSFPTLRPAGGWTLSFGDSDGSPLPAATRTAFELQSSATLDSWLPVPSTLVLRDGRFTVDIPEVPSSTAFFRAVER